MTEKQLKRKLIDYIDNCNESQLKVIEKFIKKNINEFESLRIDSVQTPVHRSVDGSLSYKREIGQY